MVPNCPNSKLSKFDVCGGPGYAYELDKVLKKKLILSLQKYVEIRLSNLANQFNQDKGIYWFCKNTTNNS